MYILYVTIPVPHVTTDAGLYIATEPTDFNNFLSALFQIKEKVKKTNNVGKSLYF